MIIPGNPPGKGGEPRAEWISCTKALAWAGEVKKSISRSYECLVSCWIVVGADDATHRCTRSWHMCPVVRREGILKQVATGQVGGDSSSSPTKE